MTGWGSRLLAMAPGLMVLSCIEPRVPPEPPPPPPVPAPGLNERPANQQPVAKPGVISRMSLGDYFPLQQAGIALTYDVRPAIYFAFGHIPGAVSWPKGGYATQLASREAEIEAAAKAKRPVVLYCTDRACPDSNTIAQRLATRGHSVVILEGGYEEWKAADLPVE
jgi:rhodanese-related sulfurtransferase